MSEFDNLKLDDLNEHEMSALRAYKAASDSNNQSACFDLNRELRNGLSINDLSAELRSVAEGLDSVFARCPRLERPVTVYRAVGWCWHLPLHERDKRFRSLEYWSTSATQTSFEAFLKAPFKGARGAVLTLHLPVGFPAYNMETLEGFGGHEAELLLPRATLWTVRAADLLAKEEIPLFVREDFETVVRAELEAQV
ncbi:MAG: ADP-ribosyltransferase [Sphingomonas sp.]|uniref:ADP-ribosyltransferase n=1 Tax=Sphingomonas sp. TaxID=28214 RepID=UPI0035A8377B|nr:ADP-ribosyltransferase [Sphingomonas sp.]